MDRIKFMNIEIDNVTMKEALHEINRLVKREEKLILFPKMLTI